ncbi:hypothetical protein [Cohnella sp. GCM10027633]|uniref:hypothetical protein n=1 Tax=unclassified Cohnella TaxID=2636738 RepID=UPI00363CA3B6
MNENELQTITVDEFAALVARELYLSRDDQAELARHAETVLQSDARWQAADEPIVYYVEDAFRCAREISREEAAAMLAFASELIGERAPMLSSTEAARTISRFKDAKLVSAWAMPALATAVRQQWMRCPDREIKPKHYMTSNEATLIVRRFATDIQ